MATFVSVPLEEMAAVLTREGFQEITLEGCKEVVYGKRVHVNGKPMPMSLRVYTGIQKTTGISRDVGKDAIRVCLVMKLPDGQVRGLGSDRRVHRVQGWKANLADRLARWEDALPEKFCPKCGLPMAVRKGKNGKFLGCVGFPACRSTMELKGG
jgi:hypothetical protein